MNCPLCSAGNQAEFSTAENGYVYFRCSRCSLIWLGADHRLSREDEASHYCLHQNFGSAYQSYLLNTVKPALEYVKPGALCLDFGCGPTEGMSGLLSPMGFRVESYDPFFFPRVLRRNRYDLVLCSESLEHLFMPGREFVRIDAAMKRSAILGVRSQLWDGLGSFKDWYYRLDPTHVCFYSKDTVEWLAAHFGWDLLELSNPYWVLRKG
jgi:hypothetical protein